MAAPRYLANISGFITMVVAAVTSAANSIVATDSTGRIDISMMPVGIIADTVIATASEAISAGALVNFYNNAGTINVRNADSTNASKPAHGFVLASVLSSGTATVYNLGQQNTAATGLTVGSVYFLSTVGALTATPPSTSGNLVQEVGVAITTTQLSTYLRSTITVA